MTCSGITQIMSAAGLCIVEPKSKTVEITISPLAVAPGGRAALTTLASKDPPDLTCLLLEL